jgi:dCMP deaminase
MPPPTNNNAVEASRHSRWISLAELTAKRSNCVRRSVGAVLIKDGEVLAKGWNGVSDDYASCRVAGCPRCIGGGDTGSGYENCICIHAEQCAIAEAARNGIAVNDAAIYVNLRPCLQCLAICRAAGVQEVYYSGEEWEYPAEVEKIYHVLSDQFAIFSRVESSAGLVVGWIPNASPIGHGR